MTPISVGCDTRNLTSSPCPGLPICKMGFECLGGFTDCYKVLAGSVHLLWGFRACFAKSQRQRQRKAETEIQTQTETEHSWPCSVGGGIGLGSQPCCHSGRRFPVGSNSRELLPTSCSDSPEPLFEQKHFYPSRSPVNSLKRGETDCPTESSVSWDLGIWARAQLFP